MSRPVHIAVLGSTGSVGLQALEVVRAYPERFVVVGLAAGSQVETLAAQALEFEPQRLALADADAAAALRDRLPRRLAARVQDGAVGVAELAAMDEADTVLAAVVGQAGLAGVVAAVRAGKRVALANKEALVMAGELVVGLARASGSRLVPVDSEHASLAQLLEPQPAGALRRVVLTASGGPFRDRTATQLGSVRPAAALAHPNWEMGAKISIDSATMMNKGFEVIEARWLFDLPLERIGVLIHPESLVHALAELIDGSVLAHLGPPDMRLPIGWALGHPERLDLGARLERFSWLELAAVGGLTFRQADPQRWSALELCREAAAAGGGMPAALAVADEVLVEAFLAERISFPAITDLLGEVLARLGPLPAASLDEVLAAGAAGGRLARSLLPGNKGTSA